MTNKKNGWHKLVGCWHKAETGNSKNTHALETKSEQHFGDFLIQQLSQFVQACERGEIAIKEC
jgi:hypothetical protein